MSKASGKKRSPFDMFSGLFREKHIKAGTLLTICVVLAVWQALSMVNSPMVLPSPKLTLKALIYIIQSDRFCTEVLVTSQRFLIGVFGSIVMGSILGILMGSSKLVKRFVEPLIYFIQATPPILYMTLAMIWFGLDGRATIFIIFLASIPIMAINIKEGFDNIDKQLIEMGNIFKFTKFEMITEIVLPSLRSYFKSGIDIVIGYGWKLVIMGEVLSSNSGLGSQITDARMNIETDKVFAWGFIVILLCFLSQKIISITTDIKILWRKSYDIKNG
jgi:NitT/TauT family transport system permease protein